MRAGQAAGNGSEHCKCPPYRRGRIDAAEYIAV